jgi:hypothetical protein
MPNITLVHSIGASRMKNECTSFRNNCGDENAEGSLSLSLSFSEICSVICFLEFVTLDSES